ncbi:MAG: MBL fold metallo-hydrolase [Verrucomicrobia bacterium]|nr:MBL fold metallo-hydrolase [Verrucomicrobiota bacterium]
MLAVDFYESGKGETIILTFPDGGLGIVDAHPSASKGRPKIEDLVSGKQVHFICLTHPHADHGLDLMAAFKAATHVGSYWHTVTDVQAIMYAVTQQDTFPSRYNPVLEVLRKDWANFLIDLYVEVGTRDDTFPGFIRRISADRRSEKVGEVDVHFFGPLEADQNKYTAVYRDRLLGKHRKKPDENSLSAVLAFQYGPNVIWLGSDALSANWIVAVERCRKEHFPKAAILKVPHHRGLDARGGGKKYNYLALCKPNSETQSVLFAGDVKHPHEAVFNDLTSRTSLMCLANGRKGGRAAEQNILNLAIPGAYTVADAQICNTHIGFKLFGDGKIERTNGAQCDFCVGKSRT